jgi:hypothetical protein
VFVSIRSIITLSYRKHHVAGPSGTSLPPVVPWFVAAFRVGSGPKLPRILIHSERKGPEAVVIDCVVWSSNPPSVLGSFIEDIAQQARPVDETSIRDLHQGQRP